MSSRRSTENGIVQSDDVGGLHRRGACRRRPRAARRRARCGRRPAAAAPRTAARSTTSVRASRAARRSGRRSRPPTISSNPSPEPTSASRSSIIVERSYIVSSPEAAPISSAAPAPHPLAQELAHREGVEVAQPIRREAGRAEAVPLGIGEPLDHVGHRPAEHLRRDLVLALLRRQVEVPVEVAPGGAHAGDHAGDVVEAVEVLVGGDERSQVEPAQLDVVAGDVVVDRHAHRPELAVGAVVEAVRADAALRCAWRASSSRTDQPRRSSS